MNIYVVYGTDFLYRFVQLVTTDEDKAIEETLSVKGHYSLAVWRNNKMLCELYMKGKEYTYEYEYDRKRIAIDEMVEVYRLLEKLNSKAK